MQGSDYLIIFFSLLMILFLTLTILCFIEVNLKKKEWLKWGSLAGLGVTIIIIGLLLWYYHGKGSNKKEEFKTPEEKANENRSNQPENENQVLIDNLKKER